MTNEPWNHLGMTEVEYLRAVSTGGPCVRAMLFARLPRYSHGGPRSDGPESLYALDELAEVAAVSRNTMQAAAAVLDCAGAELAYAARNGEVSVHDAAQIAKLSLAEQSRALQLVRSGEFRTLRAAAGLNGPETSPVAPRKDKPVKRPRRERYDNEAKRDNRRWIWTTVREFLSGGVSSAVVLYLPGPRDFDRTVAVDLGFSPRNLVAVDKDPVAIRNVKLAGGRGIVGDLSDVLLLSGIEPAAVIADLTGGIYHKTVALSEGALTFPELVFAVNCKRGRDPLAATISRSSFVPGPLKTTIDGIRVADCGILGDFGKHRACTLLSYHVAKNIELLRAAQGDELASRYIGESAVAISSYKSEDDNTVFDSGVYATPWAKIDDPLGDLRESYAHFELERKLETRAGRSWLRRLYAFKAVMARARKVERVQV